MKYIVAALINSGEGRFDEYMEGTDRLSHEVTITVKADSVDDALNKAWEVGNRMARDGEGNMWPSSVRSLSVGDVLLVHSTDGTPDTFHAVARFGFTDVSAYSAILSLLYGTDKEERA